MEFYGEVEVREKRKGDDFLILIGANICHFFFHFVYVWYILRKHEDEQFFDFCIEKGELDLFVFVFGVISLVFNLYILFSILKHGIVFFVK